MRQENRSGRHTGPSVNVNVPVLMYHEIINEPLTAGSSYKMTPSYYLSASAFECQMKALAEQGYTSIGFDDVGRLEPNGKYVIITFDDGLIGNAKYAFPILKKYGFTAVFFVLAGSIDTPRYMSWADLRELVANRMSVQSHTMSHRSLLSLNEDEIVHELKESRKCLEDKLQTAVTSLSFPHGHHDQNTIRLAHDNGYKVLCTSEVACNTAADFQKTPTVLGRITVTSKTSLGKFIRLVEYDTKEIMEEKFIKGSKNFVKRLIGIENYGRLYSLFFNIKSSS